MNNHHSKGYITAVEFANRFNLDKNMVNVVKSQGNHSQVLYSDKDGVYVNLRKIEKRIKFRYEVWNEAHDNFYKITNHISQNNLARLLAKYMGGKVHGWEAYLSQGLWFLTIVYDDSKSPLSYKIPIKLWTFWRFTTALIRQLTKKGTKKWNKRLK